jgi:hypothetical protein
VGSPINENEEILSLMCSMLMANKTFFNSLIRKPNLKLTYLTTNLIQE